MARPNKIINIGISWTGFLLAVLVSLTVVLALLWIKRNSATTVKKTPVIESFGLFKRLFKKIGRGIKKAGGTVINSVFRRRRSANSTCKPASPESEKSKPDEAKPLPELSCGTIANRTKKPTPAQANLAMQAVAKNFTKIFNDTSNPDARSKFIDLVVRQCESSKEPKYNDIRNNLTSKISLNEAEALAILKQYPCVRTFIESMSIRIQAAHTETAEADDELESDTTDDTKVSYEPTAQGDQPDSSGTMNNSAGSEEYTELEEILNDIDPELEDKFSEIQYSTCEPEDSCITGALVDNVYDSEFNELAKLYSEDLAFDLFMTNSAIYKDPENKDIINTSMEPLPNSETVASSSSKHSCSDFKASFS